MVFAKKKNQFGFEINTIINSVLELYKQRLKGSYQKLWLFWIFFLFHLSRRDEFRSYTTWSSNYSVS